MARGVSFWDMIPGEMVPRIPAAWSGDLEQHPGAARMVSTGQGSEARCGQLRTYANSRATRTTARRLNIYSYI